MPDPERGLGTSGTTFTDEQLWNAGAIIDTGFEMGLDDQTIAAALATALMESNLRNLDYGDRDSVGLFQQRPSQGWGTVEQIRDPKYAARKFFEAYLKAKGGTVLEKIANTQRPAAQYRDRYANYFDLAASAFSQVSGLSKPNLNSTAAPKVGEARSRTGGGVITSPSGAPAGGSGTVTVTTAASPTETRPDITAQSSPQQIEDYIRTYYADVAPFLGNAEMKMILYAAAIDDWDERKLDAAIENTRYWKTHGPESRRFDQMLAEDPKQAEELINAVRIRVDQAYKRQGLTKTHEQLDKVTLGYIRGGWSDQDLERHVANELKGGVDKGVGIPAGAASANADGIVAMARSMGLLLDRPTAERWALDIAAGRETEDGVRAKLTNLAKGRWGNDPDVLSHIERGGTVADYFAIHRNTIADILELNPDSVDLFNDPRYAEVTQIVDPATGKKRSMTIGEVTSWARHRDEYKNTRAYKEQAASTDYNLRRFFGEVPA